MKPTPTGWPRITSAITYRNAATMIDWLCAAYGFKVRIKVDGEEGQIIHSELEFGDGLLMVSGEKRGDADRDETARLSPATCGCNTQTLMVYVDDLDAHCARARAAGARIVTEPALHDYGEGFWADRSYGAADPEGHAWWFSERVRG